jgi:hypothetical protein
MGQRARSINWKATSENKKAANVNTDRHLKRREDFSAFRIGCFRGLTGHYK